MGSDRRKMDQNLRNGTRGISQQILKYILKENPTIIKLIYNLNLNINKQKLFRTTITKMKTTNIRERNG